MFDQYLMDNQPNENQKSMMRVIKNAFQIIPMEEPYAYIKNASYPIVTPIYAVTYEENENVDKLLAWILSEKGQYIIEETGDVGIKSDVLK